VKQEGVIAGLTIAEAIFHYLDPSSSWKSLKNEGEYVFPGQIAAVLEANTQVILKGERLALNTMQRMSGIATLSHRLAKKVADLPVRLIDTRKTTPLLRPLEKWAVLLGGCENYRFGLFDRIMIKDNHIDASGSITQALKQVNNYLHHHELQLEITVEVRNKQEIEEVLSVGGCQRIMLDNFSPAEIKQAISLIGKKMEIEASGGINEDNLREYAETGVDFISLGALTHSAGSLDLSLKIIS
jgi:nicotinate-nucleotide pyrophosphorylase (carboxylating)